MSPNNPFAGFTSQQAANYMQQQRFAAFQRQMQEQMSSGLQGANRGQFPPANSVAQAPSASDSNSNNSNASGNNDSLGSTQPALTQKVASPSHTPKDQSISNSTTAVPTQTDANSSEQNQVCHIFCLLNWYINNRGQQPGKK